MRRFYAGLGLLVALVACEPTRAPDLHDIYLFGLEDSRLSYFYGVPGSLTVEGTEVVLSEGAGDGIYAFPEALLASPDPDDDLEPDAEELDDLLPDTTEVAYDVRDVIRLIADRESFLEVHGAFAQNAVVGFARVTGRVAAFVANQPARLAGVLDIDASDKIARFIRFADAFNIPLVTLVDCPGFLPGTGQEHDGIIRHGAKIVYAYSEASVPKISVVLRKAYGGAYIVMGSRMIRTDVCLAWPTAEIAVMGAKGAVSVLHGRQLAATGVLTRDAERARLEGEYQRQFNSPFVAAASGHLDDVIYPRETRARVTAALEFLRDKQTASLPKKHGNMPL